jgi:hypothetical protein
MLNLVVCEVAARLWKVEGRKGASGSKLGPPINVCCQATVNFRSQLQEYTIYQEDDFGYVIFKKQEAYIKWHLTADSQ